jgi:hypothetical protein
MDMLQMVCVREVVDGWLWGVISEEIRAMKVNVRHEELMHVCVCASLESALCHPRRHSHLACGSSHGTLLFPPPTSCGTNALPPSFFARSLALCVCVCVSLR